MAGNGRNTNRALKDRLFSEGYRFDFYQAVRLLEAMHPNGTPVGEGVEPDKESIRFKSTVSLAFPPTDVASIRPSHNGGPPAEMDVHFLGLAGGQGPLPLHYTETIIDRVARGDTAFRDFLDIFNHRLISLLFRVRKHSRIGMDGRAPDDSRFAKYIFSLLGLGLPTLRNRLKVRDQALLKYAGLLVQKPRSSAGLVSLLSDYFDVPVSLQPFCGRWLQIDPDEHTSIGTSGQNQILGRNAALGTRVWDQSDGFDLQVQAGTLGRFMDFLPNGESSRPLYDLTRFYTDQKDFDLRLMLDGDEAPPCQIGLLSGCRLGWTSWLLSRPPDGQTFEIRIRPTVLPTAVEKVRMPFFEELRDDLLREIYGAMTRHSYSAGSAVVREGDPADTLYVVERGSVNVVHSDEEGAPVVLATLREGDFFGESALKDGGTRMATVIAAEPSQLLALTRKDVALFTTKYPVVGRLIERYLQRKEEAGDERTPLTLRLQKLLSGILPGLPIEGYAEIANNVTIHELPKDYEVVREGERGRSMFIISRGAVDVYVARQEGRRLIASLREGLFFGEMALLFAQPRTATIITSEPSELLELSRDHMVDVVARYPPIERALKVYTMQRLKALQNT